MSKGKILMLVEGAKTEIQLMERLLRTYGIGRQHQIVSYKTNIYALYHSMFRKADTEYLDILTHLREHEPDPVKKAIFDERYSDILLIFDFEPQDTYYSAEHLIQMASYFVESTDKGKLYINYPMVDAFYHMKDIPDNVYNTYIATLPELECKMYKHRVAKESRNNQYFRSFAISKAECNIVIKQNVDKAWLIANGQLQSPERMTDYQLPDSTAILKHQTGILSQHGYVSVLCTCIFYIIDYNPKLMQSDAID
jgi:hypothetical protein